MPDEKAPVDFGGLIRRLAAPAAPRAQPVRPFVASAVELDGDKPADEPRLWVVVHTITDSDLRLFHSRPIRSKRLALRIDSPGGETVQILLHAKETSMQGDLYETTGQFYH